MTELNNIISFYIKLEDLYWTLVLSEIEGVTKPSNLKSTIDIVWFLNTL